MILDIGETELTARIRHTFGMPVDSLGFGVDSATQAGRHFAFDLNRTQHRQNWRTDLPTYSFVVMAEVLEHLYTAPQLVLAFVNSLMEPNGLLVLQTPNAAAATKRIKLLLGRNP